MCRTSRLILLLVAIAGAGCLAVTACAASCLGVMSVSVTDASSFQQAITAANNGVCVDATLANSITLDSASSPQQITGTLMLSATSSGVQIDGNGGAGFVVAPGGSVNANNLTFKDFATPGNGGAFNVQSGGSLSLANDVITGNTATGSSGQAAAGGGIYNGGTLTLTNSTLQGNSATGGTGGSADGGGIDNTGVLTLTNSALQGNTATAGTGGSADGGGIYNTGTLILTDSTTTLTANQALGGPGGASSGGGIDLSSGSFQLGLDVINPDLLVYNDAIVHGTLNLAFASDTILQGLLDQQIKFFSASGNLTGDFDALEIDGISCQWTPSSAGGGLANCADPFTSSSVFAYQVTVDELSGVPPDPYYQVEITSLAAVPEPGTLSLLGPSIGVLFYMGRRRQRRRPIARLP